jgi:hypothetical protein
MRRRGRRGRGRGRKKPSECPQAHYRRLERTSVTIYLCRMEMQTVYQISPAEYINRENELEAALFKREQGLANVKYQVEFPIPNDHFTARFLKFINTVDVLTNWRA